MTPKTPAKSADKPPSELELWWDDVDGDGTNIDDAMVDWWDMAATFGHIALYFDLASEAEDIPSGNDASVTPRDTVKTAADQGMPYVRPYTPLDILDWRRDGDGTLVWVKLLEAVTTPATLESRPITTYQVRIVDEMSWKLYDYKQGKFISQGDHNLGRLPIVLLFGKRRSLLPDIGESVLGDPRNYIDLYNLTSEIRELLRNQTFSFINLPLGTGPDAMSVEAAQAMMGSQTGTMNVLFSGGAASILTGDSSNIAAYHDEISRIKREIYRETGMQWVTDSRDAEAASALELKRDEMTSRLSMYADECQRAEYQLADLFYRSKYGADLGPKRLDDDEVQIHYPEQFAQTPFKDVLDEAAAAQQLGMPAMFMKELRKSMITKFEGMSNLSAEVLKAIADEIDSAPDDPTPQEKQRQKMALLDASVKAGGKPPADVKNVNAA